MVTACNLWNKNLKNLNNSIVFYILLYYYYYDISVVLLWASVDQIPDKSIKAWHMEHIHCCLNIV